VLQTRGIYSGYLTLFTALELVFFLVKCLENQPIGETQVNEALLWTRRELLSCNWIRGQGSTLQTIEGGVWCWPGCGSLYKLSLAGGGVCVYGFCVVVACVVLCWARYKHQAHSFCVCVVWLISNNKKYFWSLTYVL